MASYSSVAASFVHKSFDVFISFRGEDTRKGFTSHLRDALIRKQIRTYVDERLNKGDEISPSLFEAIEDSHISIIVFSENYASSKWCLDELSKILECRRKRGQDVIPVFYEVDPSNIRKLKRNYSQAFKKHESDFNNHQDKSTKWKQALSEAANLAGWDSRMYRDESKLLHWIVEDVLKKLEHKYQQGESKYLFGINENLASVDSLIREFQMIGIWGMGGMGKTTIAQWFFDKYSSQYEGSCFLRNIRERFGNDGQALRTELISKLLDEPKKTNNVESYAIWRRLRCKSVFVVLDDVSTPKELEYLVEEFPWFGAGSRIIITTRDKHVLVSKGVDKIHNVKALNFQESLELFSLNTFNQNHPANQYEKLSNAVVGYAKGVPLVLKVLGSFLHSRTINEWECALNKLKRIPNNEILSVFKLSYDGLNHEEKEIFLDIACFLKGERKERVVNLLNSYDFYAEIGLRTLQDNALITVEHDVVQMHDLIQEMGWEIVRQESIKEPGARSRLWDPKEIYNVLKNNRGTDKVEGILLDMSKVRDLCLKGDTFRKMSNLRFVKLHMSSNYGDSCLHLPSTDLQFFGDKLRYLQWDGFPSKNVPLIFCTENLVEILMPNSHLEKLWDGVQDLGSLKRVVLRGSKRLVELPDFSMSSNLEEVDLSACQSLHNVHPSLLSLHSLVTLNLSLCVKLKSLQSECHLRSLEFLHLSYCTRLKKFSVSSEKMRRLNLLYTNIKMLPSSIAHLNRLECLVTSSRVENLPNELSCLRNLKELKILDGSRLMIHKQELMVIFSGLQSLEKLCLERCSNLFELPDNIGALSSLRLLGLKGSNIECLPESIKQLKKLAVINLAYCMRLRSVPDLPRSIWHIFLQGSNVESLPTSFKKYTKLESLNLSDCKRLRSVPDLPRSIRHVFLRGSNVESLPTSFKKHTKLKSLDLSDCKRLRSVPDLPRSIRHIFLRGSNVESLPTSFRKHTKLESLNLSDRKRLRPVPDLPRSIR